jgi:hypothetical protein
MPRHEGTKSTKAHEAPPPNLSWGEGLGFSFVPFVPSC